MLTWASMGSPSSSQALNTWEITQGQWGWALLGPKEGRCKRSGESPGRLHRFTGMGGEALGRPPTEESDPLLPAADVSSCSSIRSTPILRVRKLRHREVKYPS